MVREDSPLDRPVKVVRSQMPQLLLPARIFVYKPPPMNYAPATNLFQIWVLIGGALAPVIIGAALAREHFAQMPLTALPCAISATVHSIIGSLLAGSWRLRPSQK